MLNRRRLLGAVLSSLASVPFWGMGRVEREVTWGLTSSHMSWSKQEVCLNSPPVGATSPEAAEFMLERWGSYPYNVPTIQTKPSAAHWTQ